jgi:thioredoxin reductase (NADPH)
MADRYDVVVAGGGLAGLTAGFTAARLGRRTLVLTGGVPGGLLLSIEKIEGVPGFPDAVPGYELCPIAQEQAEGAGAECSMDELAGLEPADGGWRVRTTGGEHEAGVVVLATGARLKELGVPGEKDFQGRGVSHCASCDAPLLRDRVVAVVGGGDSALQESLTLAESVAQVILLHRGESLSAQASYRERALAHPRIEIRFRTVVDEVLGQDALTGVRTRDLTSGAVTDLDVAGFFPYVGLRPATEVVDGLVRLDDDGAIPVDVELRAELPGLLAAGACRRGYAGQAVNAAGDGTAAAIAAHRFLDGEAWPAEARATVAG